MRRASSATSQELLHKASQSGSHQFKGGWTRLSAACSTLHALGRGVAWECTDLGSQVSLQLIKECPCVGHVTAFLVQWRGCHAKNVRPPTLRPAVQVSIHVVAGMWTCFSMPFVDRFCICRLAICQRGLVHMRTKKDRKKQQCIGECVSSQLFVAGPCFLCPNKLYLPRYDNIKVALVQLQLPYLHLRIVIIFLHDDVDSIPFPNMMAFINDQQVNFVQLSTSVHSTVRPGQLKLGSVSCSS